MVYHLHYFALEHSLYIFAPFLPSDTDFVQQRMKPVPAKFPSFYISIAIIVLGIIFLPIGTNLRDDTSRVSVYIKYKVTLDHALQLELNRHNIDSSSWHVRRHTRKRSNMMMVTVETIATSVGRTKPRLVW